MEKSVRTQADEAAWYYRLRDFRLKLALGIGAIAIVVAFVLGLGKRALSIDPGKGTPIGYALRTDAYVAALIQTLEPYIPSPDRDHGKDTYGISLFIVPLDGSKPKLVPVRDGLSPNSFGLAKVIGSDGRTLWFDVNGIGGVDLRSYELLKPGEVRDPYVPMNASPIAPSVGDHLSAGLITGPGIWFGLHSPAELEGGFATKKFVRRVVRQEEAKEMRRFHRGTLDVPVDDKYHQILSMTPLNDAQYLSAAFLRMDKSSEPFRLSDPEGALMVFTSAPGVQGTVVMARVDLEGNVLWSTDTGIDRFALQQILPGDGSTAFVGVRPREEGKVPEPLLVIVEHISGTARTVTLWQ